MKRLGPNWKRLHRLAYPIGVIALLHYFIQSKLNVSEPVFVTGLFAWLMAWRAMPEAWQRSRTIGVTAALYTGLAAGCEPGNGGGGNHVVWPGNTG